MKTKQQFLYVYYKHSPSAFERWTYKHFNTDLRTYPIGTLLAISCFLIGVPGLIFSNGNIIWAYITMGFFSLLISLPAFIIHNARIKRIMKELDMTMAQYNYCVRLWVEDLS